jgi:hypothetical protein
MAPYRGRAHNADRRLSERNSTPMTLKELQSWLEQEYTLNISIPAIDRFLCQILG